ncbi:hypothetical protein X943_000019 [Babesia divergens]|uniref:Uncharacterized protein n=1 Tax=Babesia divergens TaxID=32595 RepID=A0AAD9LDF1_BABDI|nr:hypothetical protein X943_000019 [Babesia divergens]
MNTYKILNVTALSLLVAAFHGQYVSCDYVKGRKAAKAEKPPEKVHNLSSFKFIIDPNVPLPEEHDDIDVANKKPLKKAEAGKKVNETAASTAKASASSGTPTKPTEKPKPMINFMRAQRLYDPDEPSSDSGVQKKAE